MVIMSCEDSANSYDQVRDTASPLAVIIKVGHFLYFRVYNKVSD